VIVPSSSTIVSHDDSDTRTRRPGGFLQLGEHAFPDLVNVGRRRGLVLDQLSESSHEIGASDDANKGVTAEHRQAFHTVAFHQPHKFNEEYPLPR
jgi:hypothetical protein